MGEGGKAWVCSKRMMGLTPGVTSVMQYKHKNPPGVRTDRRLPLHIKLFMYICIQRPCLNYFNKYKEIQPFIQSAVSPPVLHSLNLKRKLSPLVTQGLDQKNKLKSTLFYCRHAVCMLMHVCVISLHVACSYYIHYEACLILAFLKHGPTAQIKIIILLLKSIKQGKRLNPMEEKSPCLYCFISI